MKVCGIAHHGVANILQNKTLPVIVGDINFIFVAKKADTPDIWIHAASGIYLLKLENCSPLYHKEMESFLERHEITN